MSRNICSAVASITCSGPSFFLTMLSSSATEDSLGAPSESSVALLESIVKKNDGPLQVIEATAEQMFLDIREDQASRLPRYRGDLELTIYACGKAVITLHASSFTLQPDSPRTDRGRSAGR